MGDGICNGYLAPAGVNVIENIWWVITPALPALSVAYPAVTHYLQRVRRQEEYSFLTINLVRRLIPNVLDYTVTGIRLESR